MVHGRSRRFLGAALLGIQRITTYDHESSDNTQTRAQIERTWEQKSIELLYEKN